MQGKNNTMIKRIVDVCMTILLLCLMAYQVTGEALHEWIGIGMTVLVIIHQLLNRKWYGALFKGKYNPYRIITTVVNIALLLSFYDKNIGFCRACYSCFNTGKCVLTQR